MSAAVDALLKIKYGKGGIYTDRGYFGTLFKADLGSNYMREVPRYSQEAIDCTKDVCTYIYRTHRRFPAHVDAIYVLGIWLQAHHLDLEYYDSLFRAGYTDTHRQHEELWHSPED